MESKQVRISLAFHTLMHFYAGFSGQASNQHFASSPKMSVSEPAADADVAVETAPGDSQAPWDREVQDSASERPSEAAFQAALIPSIDDNQFETTKASVLEKLAALQMKYGTLSAYLQKRLCRSGGPAGFPHCLGRHGSGRKAIVDIAGQTPCFLLT